MVKLITVATHYDGYLKWLEAGCKRYNVNLIKLGWGQEWKGFVWKFELLLNYLTDIIAQNPYELIIFIDGYDVLLLRPLNDIEELFNKIITITHKKIIVSKDRHNHKTILPYFVFKTCKNLLLNSGTYMGRAIDIFNMLKEIKINNINCIKDDQILLTQYCNIHKDIIYIDNDSNIFLVYMTSPEKSILDNKNIKLNKNNELIYFNAKPYFIHGPANTKLIELLIKLNYNITPEEINQIYIEGLINRNKKRRNFFTKPLPFKFI